MFHGIRTATMAFMVAAAGMGCATRTGLLRVTVPDTLDPAQGTKVRIVRVTDQRAFTGPPRDSAVPHLPEDQRGDAKVRERTVAYHYQSPFNKRVFQLSDGETVPGLVEKALVRALREAGYKVAPATDAKAIPLEVEVAKFWAWFAPDFVRSAALFACEVRIKGPLAPFEAGATLSSDASVPAPAILTPGHYHQAILKGLARLETAVQSQLKPAGAAR